MNTDRDLDKLQPSFRKKVDLWLADNPEVFVTEVFRTAERQKHLYDKGLSYIDGTNNLSMHQKGLAVDIAFHGNELYPTHHYKWAKVGESAKEYGIDWGYDLWSHTGFIDKPHFQDSGVPYVMPPELPEWQRKALDWAIANNVSNGERPQENITRVEVMEMLRKFNQNNNV